MSGVQRDVGSATSHWDFHTWDRCGELGGARNFADRKAAAFWLMQFKSDLSAMANFRTLAASSSDAGPALIRSNDNEVLKILSSLLDRGILHAHSLPAPATAFRFGQSSAVSGKETPAARSPNTSQRASTQPQPSTAPQKLAEEDDTFSYTTDGAATAAVLRSAAASGVPFCEECAKAAAARSAA